MSVFISYSHSDSDVADQIAAVLDELAISYFRDIKNIDWGDDVTTEVRDGLTAAESIIVIVSPGSLKSHWVSYEVGYGTALRKRILPYLTHPSLDAPGFMTGLSYVKSCDDVRRFFESNSKWSKPVGQSSAIPNADPALPSLSEEAATLLLKAAQADGQILAVGTLGGMIIQAGQENLVQGGNPRSEALWVGALDELEHEFLIQAKGSKREVFSVTTKGYKLADALAKSAD